MESDFGPIVLLWYNEDPDPKILRIYLSNREASDPKVYSAEIAQKIRFPNAIPQQDNEIEKVITQITKILHGKSVKFDDSRLDFSTCWGKQEEIIRTEATVEFGHLTTYADLADACNINRGARVTARALAQNPFPLIIPCHRTVRSDGDLGGYQGGLVMKQTLLEYEGIHCTIINNGKKNPPNFRIDNWVAFRASMRYENFRFEQ
jgi:methylated-DNA-[protein]-cysteine S-methyltransferase